MGHHEARASAHEAVEGALHQDLGAGVDVARGLVQDEHLRPGEHDAGDAEQLALAGGDGLVAVEHRVVAPGQAADEAVGKGLAGRFARCV